MLQFLRSKAGSFVFKILFVILIASFGIWGIGDFLRQQPQQESVIVIGSQSITGEQLRREVQNRIQRSKLAITLPQARALGVVDQTVDSEVLKSLLDQEAARQRLVIGDQQMLDTIQGDPAFKGVGGTFDRATMENLLAGAGISVPQYEADLRAQLPRSILADLMLQGAVAPAALTDLLYKARAEKRVADWVYLPNAGAGDVAPPDDKALQAYYDKHNDRYTAPEYRGFTLLPLQGSDVASDVAIGDDKLQAAYQEHMAEYTKIEKRHVLQMLLHDQKTADEASQALAQGKGFLDVAKDVAKQDQNAVDLGMVAKATLPAAVGDAAFSLKQNEPSKPIKGPFGWSIVEATEIDAGGTRSFDEVKADLEKSLRQTAEGDALYELSNKVQDALSAGADPAAIADQFKLKTVTIAAADHDGKGPDGKPVAGIVLPVDLVMGAVFDTAAGQVSQLKEVGQGESYFVVKVDKVTPAALKPLDQVKDQVKADWLAEQQSARGADQAKSLAAEIKPELSLAKAAAAHKLQSATTPAFTRTNEGREAPLPQTLIAKLFALKKGEVATAPGPQGQYVAQLVEIREADPSADKAGRDELTKSLARDIGSELAEEFAAALKQRYKVEIRQAAIDRLFSSNAE